MYVIDLMPLNDVEIQKMSPVIQSFSYRYQFTQRESEILTLIAIFGLTNREIAEHCVIAEKTVKNHVANVMRKLDIRSTRMLLSLLFKHIVSFNETRPATN
ncbi:LuxR family transcriptional regulator [Paenibacillus psychroresistens]|uniref:LuxR family transcriptional regulator n=1 Tax=Paenibacillus psychroresistens TaxID=1778678 RepID=A0A6B8RNK7_9BACL|nr:helix-turn-helix transcriptional regulator [Paenibacillus psychroresistens]QGQ97910.1 LuxR family transcriptional regulator [Paenibacillus psychroresistens]